MLQADIRPTRMRCVALPVSVLQKALAAMSLDEQTRGDFPILDRIVNGHRLVYLDSAASSQRPRTVIEAMSQYYATSHANVHRSIHTLGEEATELYEAARDRVQRFIGAASREEVVFTRGTTDGLNLVADGAGHGRCGRATRSSSPTWSTTPTSSRGRWRPAIAAPRSGRFPSRPTASSTSTAFERLLGPRTRVLAFAHVSNVLGTITPVAQLCARARAVGAVTVVDGAQAAPHLPLDMSALGCDFYVFSSHKMLGPTGIGVLWGRREVLDGPRAHARRRRDDQGSVDRPGALERPAVAVRARHAADRRGRGAERGHRVPREARHGAGGRARARRWPARPVEVLAAIPGVTVYGPPASVARGAVVAFSVEGLHPHDVAALLDQQGIAVRAGHHCAQPLMRGLGVVGHRARELLGLHLAGGGRASWRTRWRRCARGSSSTWPARSAQPVRLAPVRSARHVHAAAGGRVAGRARRRPARHPLRRWRVVPAGRTLRAARRPRAVLADPTVEPRAQGAPLREPAGGRLR